MVPSIALATEGLNVTIRFLFNLCLVGRSFALLTSYGWQAMPQKLLNLIYIGISLEREKDGALHSLGDGRPLPTASSNLSLIIQVNPRTKIGILPMFYTYILESASAPGARYVGHTSNLKKRFAEHNAGKCQNTAKNRPWEIALYIAFQTLPQAQHFERYLKSGSGHAFANRHFWPTS